MAKFTEEELTQIRQECAQEYADIKKLAQRLGRTYTSVMSTMCYRGIKMSNPYWKNRARMAAAAGANHPARKYTECRICGRRHYAKGLCKEHYNNPNRFVSASPDMPKPRRASYKTNEERAAARAEQLQRNREKRKYKVYADALCRNIPEGYVGVREACAILHVSRQRLHVLRPKLKYIVLGKKTYAYLRTALLAHMPSKAVGRPRIKPVPVCA